MLYLALEKPEFITKTFLFYNFVCIFNNDCEGRCFDKIPDNITDELAFERR